MQQVLQVLFALAVYQNQLHQDINLVQRLLSRMMSKVVFLPRLCTAPLAEMQQNKRRMCYFASTAAQPVKAVQTNAASIEGQFGQRRKEGTQLD